MNAGGQPRTAASEAILPYLLVAWARVREYTDTNDSIVEAELALSMALIAAGNHDEAVSLLLCSAACLEVAMLEAPSPAPPERPLQQDSINCIQGMHGRPIQLVRVAQCALAIIGGLVAEELRRFSEPNRGPLMKLRETSCTALRMVASGLACWDALGSPGEGPLSGAGRLAPSGRRVGVYGRVQLVHLARHFMESCCAGLEGRSESPRKMQQEVLSAGLFVYAAFLQCVATDACEALVCVTVVEAMLAHVRPARVRRHQDWSAVLQKAVSGEAGRRTVLLTASASALKVFWEQAAVAPAGGA